jgi:hypothetical protein
MDTVEIFSDGWQAGIRVMRGDPLLSEPVHAEKEDVIEVMSTLGWPAEEDSEIEIVDDGVFLISIPAPLANRIQRDGGMQLELQIGDKRFYIEIEMP